MINTTTNHNQGKEMDKPKCWVADYGTIQEAFLISVDAQNGSHLVFLLEHYMKWGEPKPNEGFQGITVTPFDVWPHEEYPPKKWADNLEVFYKPKKWGHEKEMH